MAKRMLIDALHTEETRVVIADENQIYDFDFVSTAKKQLKGNIYLAKITRVEPSLQAAFVEYGGGKQGFLPFAEIHADYYQIPVSDRKRLMEEEQREETYEETEEAASLEATREAEPYGEQPIRENNDEIPSATPVESSSQEDDDHPAYLTQGAIEVLHSDHDHPDDHKPISESLAESIPAVSYTESISEMVSEPTNDMAQQEVLAPESQDERQNAEAQAKEEGVETLASEEEEYQNRPKKNLFFKRYKIQEVIRRGQIVLVQVIKEERGNKGVSLTTYLSLAGRYCVLMPNSPKDGGISRKIASADDRKRLKAISTEFKLAQGMSVIIRTAGMDRTRAEIKRDYDYLVKLWNHIREDTLKSNAPALIYEESDIIKRAIRDQYAGDIDELIIEGDEGYKSAKEFMKLLLPSHTHKIKHYNEATPLFYAYGIEEQLLSMHDPVVKLRSGGYIVINPTEALISIDVNSGRATGERNIEETATKTNLETAAEVARQLRLRDLAGLIVIDFIDMMESRNRRAVEKALKDALKADRAKIQIGRISPFGLLEMSRQRLRSSISETNMTQCPHCVGRGVIRSNESMSIQMIRAIEKEASAGVWSSLRLVAPQAVALHLLNNKRDVLRGIEQRYNLTIQVVIGTELTTSEFNLEKMRRNAGSDRPEQSERNDRDRGPRPRRDRNDRDRGDRFERPRQPQPEMAAANETANDNAEVSEPVEASGEEGFAGNRDHKRPRRRRGGRNRNDRERGPRPHHNAGENVNESNVANPEIGGDISAAPGEGIAPVEGQQASSNRPPRGRGGRGRRPWRERDNTGRTDAQSNDWNNPAPAEGNALPAFATEDRIAAAAPAPRMPEPANANVESTPRDPNAPSKKGWWKKMIDLDD